MMIKRTQLIDSNRRLNSAGKKIRRQNFFCRLFNKANRLIAAKDSRLPFGLFRPSLSTL